MGITGCKNQDDFDRIPFSCKDDLRFANPLGIQAVDDSEVVRIHSSSGTTGRPVIIPLRKKDVDDLKSHMFATCVVDADEICKPFWNGLATGFLLGISKDP